MQGKKSSQEHKSEHIPCNEDNRVIIRVWTSGFNKEAPGENVGHVTVETTTPKGYMSLWPTGAGKGQGNGFFKPIDHEFKADHAADLKQEERPPEITICLYSLNAETIRARFNKINDDPEFKGWTLIGDNRLINGGNAHSCSSLAYELLKAGGIYELISSMFSSNFSSVVTPDGLSKAVIAAKQAELAKYPETQEFHFENEKQVEAAKPSKCSIM